MLQNNKDIMKYKKIIYMVINILALIFCDIIFL